MCTSPTIVLAPLRERYGTPRELTWSGRDQRREEFALATYNPARVHDVTLFILDPADRIALIRKPQFAEGIWRPPGGGIKPGEDFVAGAEREALEETGLDVRLDRYLVDAQRDVPPSHRTRSRGARTSSRRAPATTQLAPQDVDEIAGRGGAPPTS